MSAIVLTSSWLPIACTTSVAEVRRSSGVNANDSEVLKTITVRTNTRVNIDAQIIFLIFNFSSYVVFYLLLQIPETFQYPFIFLLPTILFYGKRGIDYSSNLLSRYPPWLLSIKNSTGEKARHSTKPGRLPTIIPEIAPW
jgi:hypothetical protein